MDFEISPSLNIIIFLCWHFYIFPEMSFQITIFEFEAYISRQKQLNAIQIGLRNVNIVRKDMTYLEFQNECERVLPSK